MAEKPQALIYVEKTRFFYVYNNGGNIVKFDFPTTMVKDMEVLNNELLSKNIQSFISVNKLTPARLYIFIARELLFSKDMTGIEEAQKDEHIKNFLENVPFEKIAQISYHKDNIFKIVATNKSLFMEIKKAFDKFYFETEVVIPTIVIEGFQTQPGQGIDGQSAAYLLGVVDSLKQFNMLDVLPPQGTFQNIAANAAAKDHPKRLPLLLGLFGGLIMILIIVIVVSSRTPTSSPMEAKTQTLPPLPVSPAPTVQPTASVNIPYTIQLLSTTTQATLSALLQRSLQEAGFVSDIKASEVTGSPSATTQVRFSQKVPPVDQEKITTILKKNIGDVKPLVVQDSSTDVTIQIGSQ